MLRALVKSNTYTVRWVLEFKAQNSYCRVLYSIHCFWYLDGVERRNLEATRRIKTHKSVF